MKAKNKANRIITGYLGKLALSFLLFSCSKGFSAFLSLVYENS
jgi:hypothetical protein